MNATPIALDLRGRRLYSLALLGVVALAACDNDRPLGPNPTTIPTTAAQAKNQNKGGKIVITIVDQNQAAPASAGAMFSLQASGQPSITVTDNSAQDADPITGVVAVKGLSAGLYEVCEKIAPTDYVLANPGCVNATLVSGGSAQVQFVNLTMGRAQFRTIDYAFNYIGGAVFKLRDSTGATLAQFTDNSPPDLDPTPGRFELKFATDGLYSLCGVTPPPGHLFVSSGCVGFTVNHGQYSSMPEFWVFPPFSAYWHVTDGTSTPDGYATLIGPSTFEVVGGSNGFSATIVDNGANDFDTRLGRLAINLPDEGWYTVCQTVAPINHQSATPNCKRTEVRKLAPGWGEFFFNYPI